MASLSDKICHAAMAYSAMRETASQYDAALDTLVGDTEFRAGAESADGSLIVVDNFACGNRIFRSQPTRRFEVVATKTRQA
jgi:hypothetical protein